MPVYAEELASARTSYEVSRPETVYLNGHYSVYPLDAIYKGIFRRANELYNMKSKHINLVDGIDCYPKDNTEEDELNLKLFDVGPLRLRAVTLKKFRSFEYS